MSDKFSITITAKARHGKLWELRKKFGSTAALAKYLEIHQSELGTWMNLKRVPGKMSQEKKDRLESKLVQYGYLLEDLFPPELTDDILDKPKDFEITRDISLQLLANAGGIKLLNGPEEESDENELKEQIRKSIYSLTPREEQVIRLRFGLDGEDEHSLHDTGNTFGVTQERVRQIEAKALRKLRHPSRSKNIKHFLKGAEPTPLRCIQDSIRYKKQDEFVFVFTSDMISKVFSVRWVTTIQMSEAFYESGTYVRVTVNDELKCAYRYQDGEAVNYNTHTVCYKEIVSVVKLRKGDRVVVQVGPVVREYVKDKNLIHDLHLELAYIPIEV